MSQQLVHRVGNHFVISEDDCWRPGAFDTEKTAQRAFAFSDEILRELQASVNPDGMITADMLRKRGGG